MKRKPGRPQIPGTERLGLSVRVRKGTTAQLKQIAERERRPLSQLVAVILEEAVKTR